MIASSYSQRQYYSQNRHQEAEGLQPRICVAAVQKSQSIDVQVCK